MAHEAIAKFPPEADQVFLRDVSIDDISSEAFILSCIAPEADQIMLSDGSGDTIASHVMILLLFSKKRRRRFYQDKVEGIIARDKDN